MAYRIYAFGSVIVTGQGNVGKLCWEGVGIFPLYIIRTDDRTFQYVLGIYSYILLL